VSDFDVVRGDLIAEQDALDDIVATITNEQWMTPTPSPGWNVADQIGHLAYFDDTASLAIVDPEGFKETMTALFEGAVATGVDEFTLGSFRALSHPDQLAKWRENRAALTRAAATLDETARVPWYGPSMGAKSFLTARLMEVWAHGTDIVDALGVERPATDRIRHIAQLGFITRKWSYKVRGEEPPAGEVRLCLTSPSGQIWTWGPEHAEDTIEGLAEDFCLVVTQRRHLDDTSLTTGELGRHWMLRAQAFAGGPTQGPAPSGR
jgi:uncharacterized protein (TIGR03084 family)